MTMHKLSFHLISNKTLLTLILAMLVTGTLLSACSSSQVELESLTLELSRSDLPDLGEAPELTNDVWLNSEGPLWLADLRGQVVLLDMWTFG